MTYIVNVQCCTWAKYHTLSKYISWVWYDLVGYGISLGLVHFLHLGDVLSTSLGLVHFLHLWVWCTFNIFGSGALSTSLSLVHVWHIFESGALSTSLGLVRFLHLWVWCTFYIFGSGALSTSLGLVLFLQMNIFWDSILFVEKTVFRVPICRM